MASVEHCLFCFDALAANLEKRASMSLYQVQNSWATYPKGLEEEESSSGLDEEPSLNSTSPPSKPRNPTLTRLSPRTPSGTSTPGSSSSASSLSPSTAETTPASSTDKFTPIGIGRRTSQRTSDIVESPLFVTWNTVSPRSSSRSLRGCIGTFETMPLSTGLSSYALTSALSDHRFSPIALAELPSLEVSVTLLTDFEDAKDAMDWELGVHGLRISFYARNKRYGACYLPDVAVEQGWDKEETIVSLMRKAGWGGRKEKWSEVGNLQVVRFQGMAESVGWEEYNLWRQWVEKGKK
ncbi:ammecr1 [Hyphodiscus hymeniophilus]|uniref:Ammecr1 n=1 Tax=Hyphodiscus hymeniophilus TaxID=353542 RepID=A0A9P6VGM3_9HELO|nr:ammecr1 [Hyphodiscus hymeniophilus]